MSQRDNSQAEVSPPKRELLVKPIEQPESPKQEKAAESPESEEMRLVPLDIANSEFLQFFK